MNIKNIDYNAMEEGFIDTDYGEIYFKHNLGTKQKIIMLHGLGGSTRAFAKFVDILPNDLDIYLIDLLGHGKSAKPKINYSVKAQTNILNNFINIKNYKDFYLFGHSYGGMVALKYILSFGIENLKGIILEDCAGLKESGNISEAYKQNMLKKALEFNNEEYVIESIINQDDDVSENDLKLLSKLDIQCLILWGENDMIVNKKYGEILNRTIKNSEFKIIENADHEPHYTNREKTKVILLEFINKVFLNINNKK